MYDVACAAGADWLTRMAPCSIRLSIMDHDRFSSNECASKTRWAQRTELTRLCLTTACSVLFSSRLASCTKSRASGCERQQLFRERNIGKRRVQACSRIQLVSLVSQLSFCRLSQR